MKQKHIAAVLLILASFILFLRQSFIAIEIRAIIAVVSAIVGTLLFYFYKIRNNEQNTPADKIRLEVFYFFMAITFLIGVYSFFAV
ncbi:hypothetical protein [Flavobacterium sp.]|uniref:hypothetical protein n=1 Tax=Flavobacterium sp. TaxID=239 RepID=UPI0026387EA7|nr:hypothetical protein [Flavobacterium sp.]